MTTWVWRCMSGHCWYSRCCRRWKRALRSCREGGKEREGGVHERPARVQSLLQVLWQRASCSCSEGMQAQVRGRRGPSSPFPFPLPARTPRAVGPLPPSPPPSIPPPFRPHLPCGHEALCEPLPPLPSLPASPHFRPHLACGHEALCELLPQSMGAPCPLDSGGRYASP